MHDWLIQALSLIGGYLCGSIPFGLVWSKARNKGDPRTIGSGNIGATNIYRMAGFKMAALVYLSDFLKSAIPVLCVPEQYKIATGLACVVGHIFSIFLGFKGGKGVATACGVMAVIMPINFLIAGVIWWLCFKITGYVSLASLVGLLCNMILTLWFFDARYIWGMGAISTLIIYAHHSNIMRLIKGNENKMNKQS
jgi:glycerol-3-phosphate acyltransferase PlsY